MYQKQSNICMYIYIVELLSTSLRTFPYYFYLHFLTHTGKIGIKQTETLPHARTHKSIYPEIKTNLYARSFLFLHHKNKTSALGSSLSEGNNTGEDERKHWSPNEHCTSQQKIRKKKSFPKHTAWRKPVQAQIQPATELQSDVHCQKTCKRDYHF